MELNLDWTELTPCIENATDFIDPKLELQQKCLQLLSTLFTQLVSGSDQSGVSSNITELYTEGFELEDIWEQLELINEPLIKQLQRYRKTLKGKSSTNFLSDIVTSHSMSHDVKEQSNESTEEDLVNEEDSNEEDDQFELSYVQSDVTDDEAPESSGYNDNHFFNLAEMNEFLKQAEEGDNIEKSSDEEGSINLFNEDTGEDKEEETDKKYLFYEEFFDPPAAPVTQDLPATNSISLPLSSYQKKQKKMEAHIAKLEATNLADKPWQMAGEITSERREENTLLEEDLLFEHGSRPAPEITEGTTLLLEDIIKQRIKDKAWDDVIRKTKPKEQPFNYKVLHRLDEEKSKLSLAEVYEQEYIRQIQTEKVEEENPKHKEINEILRSLFHKLDALANFHFTPQMPEPEIKTIPSLPSISMEEVAPVGQSDASLKAPEEIQPRSQYPELGITERSDTDKRRERRKKKKQQQIKGRLHFLKDKKRTLQEKAKLRNEAKSVRSSNKFFTHLEEEIKSSLNKKKRESNRVNLLQDNKLQHLKL